MKLKRAVLPVLFSFLCLSIAAVDGSSITFDNRLGAREPGLRQGGPLNGRFLMRVGGVAFMNTAQPDSTLAGKKIVAGYDPKAPNGERIWVTIGQERALVRAPDWIAVPAIRFANTPFSAAYTVTAEHGEGRQIHPELKNTQMGLIAYYVDHMLIDPVGLRREVMAEGKVDDAPFISPFDEERSRVAAQTIRRIKNGQGLFPEWDSFLYLDKEVAMRFSVENGELVFSGHPYILFWSGEFDEKTKQVTKWEEVKEPTDFFRRNSLILHELNPIVFQSAEKFSHLVSFFRYLKTTYPKSWASLTSAVKTVALPDPAVAASPN